MHLAPRLERLCDHLPLVVIAVAVGAEQLAGEERLQVVDVDLARAVSQVLLRDLDRLLVGAVPVPLVHRLVVNQLAQDEQQQLVVVSLEGQVAREVLWTTRGVDKILYGYIRVG